MANEQEGNERAGSIAGLGAGALTGAQIGTALIPIPLVGTFTGAVVGGVIGSEIGKRVGNVVIGTVNSVLPSRSSEPAPSEAASAPTANSSEVIAQLQQLSQLRTQGVLTEDEFRAAKSRLLGL